MEITNKNQHIMIEITMSKRYMMRIQNGVLNPDCSEMARAYKEDLITQGIIPKDNGDALICEIPSTISFVLREFLFVLSMNGSVKYYTPWIKIPVTEIDSNVPTDISNGDTISWNQWIGSNYTRQEIDGYYYFLSCAGTGNSLTDLQLLSIYILDYAELVDEIPIII